MLDVAAGQLHRAGRRAHDQPAVPVDRVGHPVEHLGDPVASGLAADYLRWSSTVCATVRVEMPDGSVLDGVADAVDWDGRLVVDMPGGTVELATSPG